MASNFRIFLLYWLPLIVYVTLVFLVSSMSRLPIDRRFIGYDKLMHAVEYALVAALIVRALGSWSRCESTWILLLVSMLGVALLGALDECYQSIIPKRDSDLFDWIADMTGGFIGAVAYLSGKYIFKKKPISLADK